MTPPRIPFLAASSALLAAVALPAQETLEQRVTRLEQQNLDLQRKVDGLGQEVERVQFGGLVPPLGKKRLGLGQGANKVDEVDQGLSLGGYGEFLFTQRSGGTDSLDAVRAVLYVGYRFDENWSFNSEIEIEHGTTETTSGTTSESGAVSLEFGYLEYAFSKRLRARAGVVLLPMGLVNEDHEPTSLLAATRAQTDQRILPTTWSEPGAELLGEFGGFTWRTAVVAGFDGERFSAEGVREARQGGNRAAADDLGAVVRVDWTGTEHLLAGGSLYWGKAGQDHVANGGAVAIPDLATTIAEAHVDWRPDRFVLRSEYAEAWVHDAGQLDAALATGVASRMRGYYGEIGYDVLPSLCEGSTQSLLPFVRAERIDTQASMPSGVARDAGLDSAVFTFGLHWRPQPQIVVKVDFENWTNSADQFHVSMGYVF